MAVDCEWTIEYNASELSINDFRACKYDNLIAIWSLLGLTDILAAFIGNGDGNTVTAPF